MSCRVVVWAITLAGIAHADDVESLHAVNVNFDFKPGWTLQLHTRARTFENIGAFNQFRVGPILIWQAKPRITVLAGYYFIDQNRRVLHEPYSLHRVWSGAQYRVARGESWAVDARGVLERFVSTEFKDYWRWRNRGMLSWKTRIGAPYVGGEGLHERGVWYARYTGGLQWKVIHDKITVGAGYEYRQALAGPGSHIIATFFQWSAYTHNPPHID